jgi:hypothetical protein
MESPRRFPQETSSGGFNKFGEGTLENCGGALRQEVPSISSTHVPLNETISFSINKLVTLLKIKLAQRIIVVRVAL